MLTFQPAKLICHQSHRTYTYTSDGHIPRQLCTDVTLSLPYVHWLCLDAKSEVEKHCSTFCLYVVNIVLPWTNQAQKIHLATYIQTVQ